MKGRRRRKIILQIRPGKLFLKRLSWDKSESWILWEEAQENHFQIHKFFMELLVSEETYPILKCESMVQNYVNNFSFRILLWMKLLFFESLIVQ